MPKTGARCGDGLRPELQALFDRLAVDPRSELFVRHDGMVQAGPDPTSETALTNVVPLRADGWIEEKGRPATVVTALEPRCHRRFSSPCRDS
jgi:hypothetical protein